METSRLETIGSAAAGIAHDINNQLTLILNHLSEPNLEGARSAVSRCASLTSGLLAFCRGESLRPQPLDTAAFLREFAAGLHLPAGIRVHLRASCCDAILADRVALGRALMNLVLNAADAMKGAGVIRIGCCAQTIFVEDDGPGIAPAVAKHIFDPFFSTKGERGNGLGLAIVREIMTQHGGRVTLRSEPGRGARFELRFRTAQPVH